MLNNKLPDHITIKDLIEEADQDFIDILKAIESQPDLKVRSQIAQNYICDKKLIKEIKYEALGYMLNNPKSFPTSWWRNIYLIERSITPRNKNYTFYQRVVMFYNTYLHESNIVSNAIAPNGTNFHPLKGSKDHPIKHDCFFAGRGEYRADFYYFDDTINGSTKDKMVNVEHKFCVQDTIEEAIAYYKNNRYIYGAYCMTLYKPNDGYYFVNFKDDIYFKLDNLKEPSNLII